MSHGGTCSPGKQGLQAAGGEEEIKLSPTAAEKAEQRSRFSEQETLQLRNGPWDARSLCLQNGEYVACVFIFKKVIKYLERNVSNCSNNPPAVCNFAQLLK